MKEALYYQKQQDGSVRCGLCPHKCLIKTAESGICGVRQNVDGILYTETYEQVSSIALDPIEKKPLNRYKPGTHILSVGTFGCNFFLSVLSKLPDIERTSGYRKNKRSRVNPTE